MKTDAAAAPRDPALPPPISRIEWPAALTAPDPQNTFLAVIGAISLHHREAEQASISCPVDDPPVQKACDESVATWAAFLDIASHAYTIANPERAWAAGMKVARNAVMELSVRDLAGPVQPAGVVTNTLLEAKRHDFDAVLDLFDHYHC